MKVRKTKVVRPAFTAGSALILAVVLTSLLAIVGVLFVMVSRVDKIATSAISENRELDFSIDAVVARIAQELVLDVPHSDPSRELQEYYDYPDVNNAWLAGLEPYEFDRVGSGDYRWRLRDLSDIYGVGLSGLEPRPEIIPDYPDPAEIGHSFGNTRYFADADGDGVADSVWVEVPDITSGTGSPIYAAVRVIDNSAMLNVNTAYKFDPCEGALVRDRGDGSSLMQINLMALAQRDHTHTDAQKDGRLWEYRCGIAPKDISIYEPNVVWRYGNPSGPFTPFDISDELKLRNRYILNYNWITTRIEKLWTNAYDVGPRVPLPTQDYDLPRWFDCTNFSPAAPNDYDYRHISTTYNMDRIIAPDGQPMLNVNNADKYDLRDRITAALLNAGFDDDNAKAVGAQITANLIDFRDNRDNDDIVTDVCDVDGFPFYGFERPCIYISELAHSSKANPAAVNDANLPAFYRSYAVELYKPYFEDEDPTLDWQLVIDNPSEVVDVNWSGTRRFHVIKWEDPNALLPVSFYDPSGPNPVNEAEYVDPNVVLRWPAVADACSYNVYFGPNETAVTNADTADPNVYKGNFDANVNTYDPNGPNCLGYDTIYWWRIDTVTSTDTVHGIVWWFETGPSDYNYSEPNSQPYSRIAGDRDVFRVGSVIELRRVAENGVPVVVDSIQVPNWLVADAGIRSFQRDITPHKCIRRLWDSGASTATLGYTNMFRDRSDPNIMIQAHPSNVDFVGIGDIGKVFAVDASLIGPSDTEAAVRIDLANPAFGQLLNYLTVFDPTSDGIDNNGDGYGVGLNLDPNELKIPGRININTAPWYVIAQLPWVRPQTAQAIVAYRDKLRLRNVVDYSPYYIDGKDRGRGRGMVDLRDDSLAAVVRESPGFASVAELLNVTHDLAEKGSPWYEGPFDIRQYGRDISDVADFPDLTPADGAEDDLEERDLICARISNLVTVRSDVFTAYILVRIGVDGPQKRAVAILDRSNVYYDPAVTQTVGRVRIIALHPVPDPR